MKTIQCLISYEVTHP